MSETVIDIRDFAVDVKEEDHELLCEGGWINIGHPMRAGVIMQRLPCGRCNADATKPDPQQSDVLWTVDEDGKITVTSKS